MLYFMVPVLMLQRNSYLNLNEKTDNKDSTRAKKRIKVQPRRKGMTILYPTEVRIHCSRPMTTTTTTTVITAILVAVHRRNVAAAVEEKEIVMIRIMVEEEVEVVDRTATAMTTFLLLTITVAVVHIVTIEVVVLPTTPRIHHSLILIITDHMVVVVEVHMVILHHLPVATLLHLHRRHTIVEAVVNCMDIGTVTTIARTMIHTVVLVTTITTVGLQDGMTVIRVLASVGIGAVARKGGWM
mmetsp:Transcript_54133/g.131370  ORF Transcript_54133/g.131370 Transcript_54133/m.131370 type:complete len:241 (+) Transcript_54133:595-1317(+)